MEEGSEELEKYQPRILPSYAHERHKTLSMSYALERHKTISNFDYVCGRSPKFYPSTPKQQ